jgi:hypothetical protein
MRTERGATSAGRRVYDDGQPDLPCGSRAELLVAASAITWCDCRSHGGGARSRRSGRQSRRILGLLRESGTGCSGRNAAPILPSPGTRIAGARRSGIRDPRVGLPQELVGRPWWRLLLHMLHADASRLVEPDLFIGSPPIEWLCTCDAIEAGGGHQGILLYDQDRNHPSPTLMLAF